MRVVIRTTAPEEAKALPILLRPLPGLVLPDRTYVLALEAVQALRDAGIAFTELGSEADTPGLEGAVSGERV